MRSPPALPLIQLTSAKFPEVSTPQTQQQTCWYVLPHTPAVWTSSICLSEQLWESLSSENEVIFHIRKSHSSWSFSQSFLKAHFSNFTKKLGS